MESKILDLYEVRDYVPGDKNFVMATFLRGLYYGNDFYNLIPKQIFMDNYKLVGEAFFSDRYKIYVACLKEDKDVILGFSVLTADHQSIAWVFVKAAWRKQGIAKTLLPKYPKYITNFTTLGLTLLPKFKNCVFNPFSA